jgi:hypothetical protein
MWEMIKKINPITGLDRPWGFQEVEVPRFQDSRHMKVVRLSAVRTGSLYTTGNIPVTHFCWRLSHPRATVRPEGLCHWKIPTTPSGIGPANLQACSAVPQPTAPPRTPGGYSTFLIFMTQYNLVWNGALCCCFVSWSTYLRPFLACHEVISIPNPGWSCPLQYHLLVRARQTRSEHVRFDRA